MCPPLTDFAENAAFQTTHWSIVLAARGHEDETQAGEALASLCKAYWYPLYAFVRRQGFTAHEAEDLTQQFFYQLLERRGLRNVQRVGKFRSFLLTCLKYFLADEWKKSHAQKRGGGQSHTINWDSEEAETRFSIEPVDQTTPETLFEKRWAFTVLEQTIKALEEEYASKKKAADFAQLKGFLPGGHGQSRSELAARRGISVGAVDVAVHRLRQRFGDLLREQVARTVSSETEVDAEIRYLMTVLSK